jgi:hypothetical protein
MEKQTASKYKYLATKLKECREKATPRLKQQELADLMAASGVPVKRTTITNWETGYADPSEEALFVYARLRGDSYWWWLLWFIDDSAKPGLTVDYNNQGQKTLQEPEWDESDYEGMQEAYEIDHLAEKELSTPPKKGPLAQALRLKPAETVEAIRRMLNQPQPHSNPIGYLDSNGKPMSEEEYLKTKQTSTTYEFSIPPSATKQEVPEGGLAAYARLNSQKNDATWDAQSSSFFNAVQHLITKKIPEAYPFFKTEIRSGSLKSRADFFNGDFVVEFVVAKSNVLTLELTRGLGKLLLIDKMLTRSKPKMLVICTNIDRPQTNPKLLDDQSTAKGMGIELLFVSPQDETIAAEAVLDFITVLGAPD